VLHSHSRCQASFSKWREAIRDACPGPWAVTGDFNLILNEADKSNDRIDRANLRRFRRTVANLELQDLHLHGRCFTWSNERDVPTLIRLDRVLVSIDWDTRFPNSHLRALGTDASDHCALLLQTNMGQMSKARFHFEQFWPKFDDYFGSRGQCLATAHRATGPIICLG
jgi:endonuclease/exonuclease/phosphatase family metal-dependent hydrolase